MPEQITDAFLALLPVYGPWLLGLTTYLSCLALPVPSSLMMIASGAFVASGDLSGAVMIGSAFGGAVLGDQTGFHLGRRATRFLPDDGSPKGKLLREAIHKLQAKGWMTVYLSRWLFSPLGPYVNLAAGATGYSRRAFSLADLAGEATWVALYIGLGITFGANLTAASEFAANMLGLIAAGVIALGLLWWLWRAAHAPTQD
ncbi:DedA family protein [Thioclava sp. A2]|uniref:DedA family protein n=1 Tax=Thioclava sp. FCG-A2 TaxID=3080562 RepID=UPI002952E3F1|nr:DedA family protein [Thioclava sp. A2]MDV7269887.1 DedA family protein [Thioclava sp. A2]